MSEQAHRILLVDDSPADIRFNLENLKHDYTVVAANGGIRAIQMLESMPQLPDLILMDVEMPEQNGYQTCQIIKKNPDWNHIEVIFVSGHDTPEEKLAGYDAGGSDYVIKPYDTKELKQKIRLAINHQEQQRILANNQQQAMQTAMTALTSAGELGIVLEFMKQSYSAHTFSMVAEQLVAALANYQLDSTVQIHITGEIYQHSTRNPIPPLESELLIRLRHSGKILEKESRLIMNGDNISLFVKNMPHQDSEQYGRYRDNIAMLIDSAASRLHALYIEQENQHRKQMLEKLMSDTEAKLHQIRQTQRHLKENYLTSIRNILSDLEEPFLSWGLSEEQEQKLTDAINLSETKALELFEQGVEIDEMHSMIRERLDLLMH